MNTFRLTEPIFHALCADGVSSVAQRIGITYQRLLQILKTDPRVKEWQVKYQKVLELP